MISSQNLINKICCTLDEGGLTALQCCQAENALTLLCQPVFNVNTCANLPNAAIYNGRMIYVDDEQKYYYSALNEWSDDLSSTPRPGPDDFELYAWGRNTCGQLGDNTITSRLSPVKVMGEFDDWCQVSAGGASHSLAVRQNGTAWAWGNNCCGKLGDNTVIVKSSPVSIVGGFCDWSQVSAGGTFSLGLRTDGTLWAWGQGLSGRLGDNTTVNKSSPVSVVGDFCDWCQVSAGSSHSLGVRTNGSAWAWGYGGSGRLGINITTARSSPAQVAGGFTDWCQVSGGSAHSLGVRQNGTAWAWGLNTCGRLGINNITSTISPVTVIGGFCDWSQVAAGDQHSLAVRQNGTAWAWGNNAQGRLGDNTNVNKSSPVQVVGGFTDWCQISAGGYHSLGVRQNGTAWAWGSNSGQLGDNTVNLRSSPVAVVGLRGVDSWCKVSAGNDFSLGIQSANIGV